MKHVFRHLCVLERLECHIVRRIKIVVGMNVGSREYIGVDDLAVGNGSQRYIDLHLILQVGVRKRDCDLAVFGRCSRTDYRHFAVVADQTLG